MTNLPSTNPISYLRDEYERQKALFYAQSPITQHFTEAQAQRLTEAILNNARQAHFTLPDRVVDKTPHSGDMATMLVPANLREHTLGGWRARLNGQNLRDLLRLALSQLEQSPDQAIHSCAELLRFAVANHMIYNLLPDGRPVTYRAERDEEIPTIPVKSAAEASSALTQAGDAIAEENTAENGRGELHVPFVPAARRFYLPQWVAFDEQGSLLVNSVNEAEARQASMERFVAILHAASSLAPYMLADETYQRKRYGMLGQVINQGRALAGYKTRQIIQALKDRAKTGTLNRGLSISLPYYDDQELRMSELGVEMIPAGRIMFQPAFIVRAVRLEHAKVAQDTRLNASTRKYLLAELNLFEETFLHYRPELDKG